MMQDLMSCCSNHDVSILYRVLSVIEGMCSKLEMVPDNDIVSPFPSSHPDRRRGSALHRRPQQVPLGELEQSQLPPPHSAR